MRLIAVLLLLAACGCQAIQSDPILGGQDSTRLSGSLDQQ